MSRKKKKKNPENKHERMQIWKKAHKKENKPEEHKQDGRRWQMNAGCICNSR